MGFIKTPIKLHICHGPEVEYTGHYKLLLALKACNRPGLAHYRESLSDRVR